MELMNIDENFQPILSIDKKAGSAYLKFTEKKIARTVKSTISIGNLLDLDDEGKIVGIEWINFKNIDLKIFKPSVIKNLKIELND